MVNFNYVLCNLPQNFRSVGASSDNLDLSHKHKQQDKRHLTNRLLIGGEPEQCITVIRTRNFLQWLRYRPFIPCSMPLECPPTQYYYLVHKSKILYHAINIVSLNVIETLAVVIELGYVIKKRAKSNFNVRLWPKGRTQRIQYLENNYFLL